MLLSHKILRASSIKLHALSYPVSPALEWIDDVLYSCELSRVDTARLWLQAP